MEPKASEDTALLLEQSSDATPTRHLLKDNMYDEQKRQHRKPRGYVYLKNVTISLTKIVLETALDHRFILFW